ncbi:hypothetical protein [Pontibacter ummariensis]|nr:hypothetical protein [Pontibacter ummariensis]
MGKRQIRIFRKDLLQHNLELLQRPTVQVVLRNRVVLTGVLRAVDPAGLQLQDQRFHRHTMPMEEVEEVIYDIEAAY